MDCSCTAFLGGSGIPGSINRYTVDGNSVHFLAELYDEFSRQMVLPREFGRNLDAHWDVLSSDVEGPFENRLEALRTFEIRNEKRFRTTHEYIS
jgi:RNAse (barnase) inhibitor barstar